MAFGVLVLPATGGPVTGVQVVGHLWAATGVHRVHRVGVGAGQGDPGGEPVAWGQGMAGVKLWLWVCGLLWVSLCPWPFGDPHPRSRDRLWPGFIGYCH